MTGKGCRLASSAASRLPPPPTLAFGPSRTNGAHAYRMGRTGTQLASLLTLSQLEGILTSRREKVTAPTPQEAFQPGGRQEGRCLSDIRTASLVSLLCTRDNSLEKNPRNALGQTEGADGRDEDGQDVPCAWSRSPPPGPLPLYSQHGVGGQVSRGLPSPVPPQRLSDHFPSTADCREPPFLAEFNHQECGSNVGLTRGWRRVPAPGQVAFLRGGCLPGALRVLRTAGNKTKKDLLLAEGHHPSRRPPQQAQVSPPPAEGTAWQKRAREGRGRRPTQRPCLILEHSFCSEGLSGFHSCCRLWWHIPLPLEPLVFLHFLRMRTRNRIRGLWPC